MGEKPQLPLRNPCDFFVRFNSSRGGKRLVMILMTLTSEDSSGSCFMYEDG